MVSSIVDDIERTEGSLFAMRGIPKRGVIGFYRNAYSLYYSRCRGSRK
jgi:hypothetical protein